MVIVDVNDLCSHVEGNVVLPEALGVIIVESVPPIPSESKLVLLALNLSGFPVEKSSVKAPVGALPVFDIFTVYDGVA